jgi:DNA-binding MarR family transcriptional regulator
VRRGKPLLSRSFAPPTCAGAFLRQPAAEQIPDATMTPRDSECPRLRAKNSFPPSFSVVPRGKREYDSKQSVITPMSETTHHPLAAQELGPCLCSQVRRIARRLSSFYDAALSGEQLTITQYSLLANISRAGQVSHAALAEKVGMERTTLTRNLRPLTRAKWVITAIGEDRRQHLLQLTAEGKRKLARTLPLWQVAQGQFISQMGTDPVQDLRANLASAEFAVSKAFAVKKEDPKPATRNQ